MGELIVNRGGQVGGERRNRLNPPQNLAVSGDTRQHPGTVSLKGTRGARRFPRGCQGRRSLSSGRWPRACSLPLGTGVEFCPFQLGGFEQIMMAVVTPTLRLPADQVRRESTQTPQLSRTWPRLGAPPQAPEGLARVGPHCFDFPRDTPQHNSELPDRLIFSLSIFSLLFITVQTFGRIYK